MPALLGKYNPAFRYNLFVGTAIYTCHVELVETSTHNKQSFDKLRMTYTKSIFTSPDSYRDGFNEPKPVQGTCQLNPTAMKSPQASATSADL